jgi:DNA-directed RNA polymerase specialized sigma24 family protein
MQRATLFTRLGEDWADLVADPAAARRYAAWRAGDGALAAHASLPDLRAAAHRRGDPQASDRILAALVRRAATDDLAARVLLHLLLPGAKALTARLWWLADPEERAAAAVAAVYERIRTYPYARRPARIAANILADARQQLTRRHRPRDTALRTLPLDEADEHRLPPVPDRPQPSAAEELLDLLRWAVALGHLSAEQGRLIAATRLADVGCDELGAQVGLGAHSLRRRRQRAESALRDTVRALGPAAGLRG